MVFRVFRYATGVILGALAIWLIVHGVMEGAKLLGGVVTAGKLAGPALRIIGGLVIAGAYYYALWSDSSMRRILENILSIPELVRKLIFTLALLAIYRIGYHVPLPGFNQDAVKDWMKGAAGFGEALSTFMMFTAGNLEQSTLFGLGIMPYISASIILQLLVTVVPSLQKLQKEGPVGYRKIQEYTRYLTVILCLVQAAFWLSVMRSGDNKLLYPQYQNSMLLYIMDVMGLTCGTVFLMWLGEQIDEYGIGNGISLLIMAGILCNLPFAIKQLGQLYENGQVGVVEVGFLACAFVFVVAGAILITQAQRRIPIQQAKHVRGRRVYGGQRQYLPLRVNHGGVMPIIFASSLMIFPNLLFKWINGQFRTNFTSALENAFQYGSYTYVLIYVAMIFFFAYFWTTVQFRPKEMADQLRDNGSFIPGLRPGKRTSDYLERVMERITYCGAAFLSAVAVVPMVITSYMNIPFQVAAFLGGTGLLIVVSVALDLVQRIEANLVMRNYGGFLGGSTRIKGAYT